MKQALSMVAIFFAFASYVQGSLAAQSTLTVVKGEIVFNMNYEAQSPKQADGRYIWKQTSFSYTTKIYIKPSIKAPFPEKPILVEEEVQEAATLLVFDPKKKGLGECGEMPCGEDDMRSDYFIAVETNNDQTGFVAPKNKENEKFYEGLEEVFRFFLSHYSENQEILDKFEKEGYGEPELELGSKPWECIFKGGVAGLKSVVNCRVVIPMTLKMAKDSK